MVVEESDPLSAAFGALEDPTRREILRRLAAGPASVSELCEPFEMSQQAISKHLACLERARLIRKRREGRRQICTLRAEPIRAVADWAIAYRQFWEHSLDNLEDYLAGLQAGKSPRRGNPRSRRGTRERKK